MRNLKLIVALLCASLFLSVFYLLELHEEIKGKELRIEQLLESETKAREKVASVEEKVKNYELLLQNISKAKESELRNLSWEELKSFLELDKTNELIYDEENFDCSGFALELFKRARSIGLKVAIVEVEFPNQKAHVLNAFQTLDQGLVFVDVTGNEKGNGRDKVAYLQKGKIYGTIALEGLLRKRIDCDISCEQLARGLSYKEYGNVFDYTYFTEVKRCVELHKNCVNEYNLAVEKYNSGSREYSYQQLQEWLKNLKALKKEIGSQDVYFVSELSVVENWQIYW